MFAHLDIMRKTPLPPLAESRAALENYRAVAIDREAPQFSEPLLDVRSFGLRGRNFYAHARNPPYWAKAPGAIEALLLRESAARRLARVDAALSGAGVRLFVLDAWRPRAVQAYFHDVWAPQEIAQARPELSGAALEAEVSRYWSKPSQSPDAPAPHETGGAVDLTLTFEDGEPLWMGSLFDEVTPLAWTDRFEGREQDSVSDREAQANRRLLYWAMTTEGFVNYPNEWWHFSWGDQMWARLSEAGKACFGLAAPA